jgi:predicted DNA-binding antitoxin AbrB/MazE fold protein
MYGVTDSEDFDMTRVDAIYQDGVFRPLEPVALCENQRVALSVEPISKEDALAWAKEEQAEDIADVKAAEAAEVEAAAKGETPIPWEEARQQLGL